MRQLVQFSRAEVRSEHVWLERLSLPCVLETALEALASLPDDQLLVAAEAAQLPAAVGCLPAAARAGPLGALLRRLSAAGSEPALRLAADMFRDLYTAGESNAVTVSFFLDLVSVVWWISEVNIHTEPCPLHRFYI